MDAAQDVSDTMKDSKESKQKEAWRRDEVDGGAFVEDYGSSWKERRRVKVEKQSRLNMTHCVKSFLISSSYKGLKNSTSV